MLGVTYQVSGVTGKLETKILLKPEKVVEQVDLGSVINGATPSSFSMQYLCKIFCRSLQLVL